MKKEKYMSWDTYFMSVAIISSFRSKDKKTQTGACIVDENKKIVGVGYNGLPIGFNDNNPLFWNDDASQNFEFSEGLGIVSKKNSLNNDENLISSKHTYVIHAEKNAIFNKTIQSIKGASLYVSLFPCKECAKSIIQTEIKKVVYLKIKEHHEDENKAVKFMFKEVGINLINFNELDIKDKEFISKLQEINKFYE